MTIILVPTNHKNADETPRTAHATVTLYVKSRACSLHLHIHYIKSGSTPCVGFSWVATGENTNLLSSLLALCVGDWGCVGSYKNKNLLPKIIIFIAIYWTKFAHNTSYTIDFFIIGYRTLAWRYGADIQPFCMEMPGELAMHDSISSNVDAFQLNEFLNRMKNEGVMPY